MPLMVMRAISVVSGLSCRVLQIFGVSQTTFGSPGMVGGVLKLKRVYYLHHSRTCLYYGALETVHHCALLNQLCSWTQSGNLWASHARRQPGSSSPLLSNNRIYGIYLYSTFHCAADWRLLRSLEAIPDHACKSQIIRPA